MRACVRACVCVCVAVLAGKNQQWCSSAYCTGWHEQHSTHTHMPLQLASTAHQPPSRPLSHSLINSNPWPLPMPYIGSLFHCSLQLRVNPFSIIETIFILPWLCSDLLNLSLNFVYKEIEQTVSYANVIYSCKLLIPSKNSLSQKTKTHGLIKDFLFYTEQNFWPIFKLDHCTEPVFFQLHEYNKMY